MDTIGYFIIGLVDNIVPTTIGQFFFSPNLKDFLFFSFKNVNLNKNVNHKNANHKSVSLNKIDKSVQLMDDG